MDSNVVAVVGIVALVVVFALALNRSFSIKGSSKEFEFKTGSSESAESREEP